MISSACDIARLSLEFAVQCDQPGIVLWADERAQQRVRVVPGGALADLCVPGTTAKAQELTRQASAAPVDDRELSFGVGLRLPVAKGLTEMRGGGNSVEIRPGEGSTFTVVIPGGVETGL